ncbi:MAG: helix-turn-helix domain-containing protein [Pyrinomonadaceae bacterium]
MICPKCEIEMKKVPGDYHFTESGLDNAYLTDSLFECSECGMDLALFPNPEEFTQAVVHFLIHHQKERLNGDQILFLRKAMGLTGAALAEFLDKPRGEISRWENGRAFISPLLDMRLRVEAARRLLSPQEAREAELAVADTLLHTYKETTASQQITLRRSWNVVVPELAATA